MVDKYTELKQQLQETKDKILYIEKELQDTPRVNKIEFRGEIIHFTYHYYKELVMNPSITIDKDIKETIENLSYEDKLNIIAYDGSTNSYWLMYITNYLVRDLGYEIKLTSSLNSFDFIKKIDS